MSTAFSQPERPVDTLMHDVRRRVRAFLPDIARLAKKDLAVIFLTYDDLIHPNVSRWMMRTLRACGSDVARGACDAHFKIAEKHQRMLFECLAPISDTYDVDEQVEHVVACPSTRASLLQLHSGSRGAFEGLLILAALKNASLEFLAWFEKAAGVLGLSESARTYFETRRVASEHPAYNLEEAAEAEAQFQGLDPTHAQRYETVEPVVDLLRIIFRAHLH
jgi:hypothetical protein